MKLQPGQTVETWPPATPGQYAAIVAAISVFERQTRPRRLLPTRVTPWQQAALEEAVSTNQIEVRQG